MKKIALLLLALPFTVFAQEYSEVLPVPGKTANQLYSSAREWFALTFNSANQVLQMDDPSLGKLIGKGYSELSHAVNGVIVPIDSYFTLIVELKDERYRYNIMTTSIKTRGGEEYTYQQLKNMTTEEGLQNHYKEKKVKAWMVGKDQFAKNLEANKMLVANIEGHLKDIVKNLKSAMSSESKDDDW